MGVTIGTQLGSLQITALVGKGGMGEVYRARDSKLKREVAIKILPEEFSRDPDRLSRFQREAEIVASLNHPNIGAIYDIQEQAGARFLVLELVEGETLAQRIARGPIPVEDALNIARQICDALEAAHEKGIVHRDLKPANVKVQPDGKVKVLDFGLAKALEKSPASSALSQSPTLSLAATSAGVIIGTAAYMSPEQARGLDADHRSDVFALGCVLYEMLTGRQGFQGDTLSDVLASVLKLDPELNLVPPKLNPKIRELLRRCLDKNPKRRWQAVGDLRIEIELALADPFGPRVVGPAVAAPKPLWKRAAPALATLILGALASVLVTWNLRPAPPAPVVTRFSFTLGDGQQFTGTANNLVAISPDGTQIVYVANGRLYLRRMGEIEAKVIPGSETAGSPFVFSPDGSSIAFYSGTDNALKRIAVSGGAAITLCSATSLVGMSWADDDILFGQLSGGILRVSQNGGKPESLVAAKENETVGFPQMLPGGKAVLLSLATGAEADRGDKGQIVVQSIPSGERKILIEGGSDGRYVASGHIVYAFSGTLRAVPFDLRRLEVRGGPVPVIEGIRRVMLGDATGLANFSFSSNGSLVYVPGPVSASGNLDLALFDRNGAVAPLKLQPGQYSHPRISPNGKHVAFASDDGKDAIIWIYDLAGGTSMRRLTFGGKNRYPVWSPDSKWLAFQSDREGDLGIFQQRADVSGTAERLTKPDPGTEHVPSSWSPNGETLLFTLRKDSTGSLMALSLRDKKATPFGNVQNSNPIDAVFSPDGRWVAYTSRETGRVEVFVQPFPATGAKYQIPSPRSADNHAPIWSADGKELFHIPGPRRLAAVSIAFQPSFAVGNAIDVFRVNYNNPPTVSRNFDITADGKRSIATVDASQSQIGPASAPQIQVVLNWFDELKRRVAVH